MNKHATPFREVADKAAKQIEEICAMLEDATGHTVTADRCEGVTRVVLSLDVRTVRNVSPEPEPDACTPDHRLCRHGKRFCDGEFDGWTCVRESGHSGKCIVCVGDDHNVETWSEHGKGTA